ncbi:MAG: GNAT family N-acetyltransferase, partial [Gammaproteobacteria bacterium]|nr:GNAT family N-acetyltransferase [Gammaproteobacteria bacterium]
LYFIGEGNADYTDFVTNTNKDIFLNRVFDVILSHKDKWDNLVLNNIPEFSKTTEIIKELCGKNKLKFHYHNNIICPTLEIKGNQKNLNKITNKKSIARKLNYYYKTGKINFKNISNLEQAKRHLENFFKQHITRCSIADYNSLFLNENNKIFYRKLLDELLPGKWIIFSVIEFDDRPISYHFGFDYNNKVIWYKPSFDISFYKHSPGQLMVKHLIDYSIKNDREELDFTIGDENFKHRFTNKIKRNCYIKIYSKNSSYYINRMMSLLIRIAKPISNKLTSA